MRVIGLMSAWGCEKWINLSIENHLRIVDELYVAVQPYHKLLEGLKDDTYDIANDIWRKNDRVKIFNPGISGGSRKGVSCKIKNFLLRYAKPEVGDVIAICDVDEFYDSSIVYELSEWFTDFSWDGLIVAGNFYAVNLKHYIKSATGHGRFYRVNSEDVYFEPEQHFKPRPTKMRKAISGCPMFHYAMLIGCGHKYKDLFWRAAGNDRSEWLNKIYQKWTPGDIGRCEELATLNESITGNHGFWFNDNEVERKPPYYLFEDKVENHPSLIKKSWIAQVDDFREI